MAYPTHGFEYHERNPWKTACRVATTANITISTALNDGDTLDGVTLATGDRVLVKNQSTPSQNGIYIVSASPARAVDFDSNDDIIGAVIVVSEGTANADTMWLCTTNATITVGSTSLAFTQIGGDLASHLVDTSDAHDASAISFSPASGIAATDVQAAIVEDATDLADHLADSTDAHDASAVSVVPFGSIAATNVQDALQEVMAEAGGGGGGGASNIVDTASGIKFDTGFNLFQDADELAYIYLDGGTPEIGASADGVWLGPDIGYPVIVFQGDGLLLPQDNTTDPVAFDHGQIYYNPNARQLRLNVDGPFASDLWETIGGNGWAPAAFHPRFVGNGAYTTALNLAVGEVMVCPIFVPSFMRVHAFLFWNTDAASARAFEVALYGRDLNDSNSLVQIPGSNDFNSWTPGAASERGTVYGSPFILAPGIYWLALRNDHGSNTLGVGTLAASAQIAPTAYQRKTTTIADPLDMVAATWTKGSAIPGVYLGGEVFDDSVTW